MSRAARRLALHAKLEALLAEFDDVVGPQRCAVCSDDEHCHHSPEDGTATRIPNTFLRGWALVHSWDTLDGNGYWDWEASQGQSLTSVLGLGITFTDDLRDRLRRPRG